MISAERHKCVVVILDKAEDNKEEIQERNNKQKDPQDV